MLTILATCRLEGLGCSLAACTSSLKSNDNSSVCTFQMTPRTFVSPAKASVNLQEQPWRKTLCHWLELAHELPLISQYGLQGAVIRHKLPQVKSTFLEEFLGTFVKLQRVMTAVGSTNNVIYICRCYQMLNELWLGISVSF